MDGRDKKVLVFGTGRSGIGAADLLLRLGARPVFYDEKPGATVESIRAALPEEMKQLPVLLPGRSDEIIRDVDLVVISPGVPLDIPSVKAIQKKKIPVWGEVELAYQASKGRILAITGTNGKTTTVSLLGKIMSDAFPEVYVVGNIGKPYTKAAGKMSDEAWTVAEISSFQLETIQDFHPFGAAITNITEDHLNRHHTMEEYIRVKERICENQKPGDVTVLNYEDEVLREFGKGLPTEVIYFSSRRRLEKGLYLEDGRIFIADASGRRPLLDTADLHILGLHNYENVMTAAALALKAGVSPEKIVRSAKEFRGVAHRIEFVEEIKGVAYYNDSKGTNPDAAIKGIQAMNRPTLLIGGGYDKESSYDKWIQSFEDKVRLFVLIGETREKIREAAIRNGFPKEKILLFETLKEAVTACAMRAKEGEAVLLSPACASWDQFKDYEERGDFFKAYVRALATGKAGA